jgi:hypothetical protein
MSKVTFLDKTDTRVGVGHHMGRARRVVLNFLGVGYGVGIGANQLGSFIAGLAEVTWWNSFHQVCSHTSPFLRFGGELLFQL